MDRVVASPEFSRIDALPRVDFEAVGLEWLPRVQAALKTRHGTMVLLPWQVAALVYAAEFNGVFVSAGVGAGKTLVTLLLPVICAAKRPLLMLPAAAREKTYAEIPEYQRHFLYNHRLRILAYEELSRLSGVQALMAMRPDLLILDEAHKLKDVTTARGRRYMRYMADHPETNIAALSGTPTTTSIEEYAHHVGFALRDGSPVPRTYHDLQMFMGALDLKPRAFCAPGPLRQWCAPGETVRKAWQRRFGETPGVILTKAASSDAALHIEKKQIEVSPDVRKAIDKLYSSWVTPGGEECQYAMELWRHGRELSCGFYYRWVWPRAADGTELVNRRWLNARAAWHKFVRQTIQRDMGLDSPLAVEHAVRDGQVFDLGGVYAKWMAVRGEYRPVTEPVWISDFFVKAVIAEARARRGSLVWVEHSAFGARLHRYGLPYYGPKATQADINAAKGSIALSQRAHREAKNLQVRHDNVVVSPPASGSEWEQMLGRTHRLGQKNPVVACAVYQHTQPFKESLACAINAARYMQETMGQRQKLLMARWV